ncbi:MAG: ATP-binding cassette domain-containing protein [Acetobacteraceae bacterium]|nr:ATP-binding cassette domain-containing protein [Acetobacteraceae bacterium]
MEAEGAGRTSPAGPGAGGAGQAWALEVEEVCFSYEDGTQALRGATLRVPAGARMALIGPNGAGKSTLLLHLNGLYSPSAGRVRVLGRELGPADRRWARRQVGLLFQDPDDQLFCATVEEDVGFGPANLGLEGEELSRRVREALEAVGMWELRGRAPSALSLGEKRRAALAGVLALHPRILALDEPAAHLDARGRAQLLDLLGRAAPEGLTFVMATHDVDFAAEWADRVAVMQAGRVVAQGGRELLADADLLQGSGLEPPTVLRLFCGLSPATPLTLAEGRRLLAEMAARRGSGS